MRRFFFLLSFVLICARGVKAETPGDFFARIKWSGDIRLRTEIESDNGADDRWKEKLRARLRAKVQVQENMRVELGLASSKSNRSSNQTLGDGKEPGSPRRFFGLDLAYAEWAPVSYWKLEAGRIPQVHIRPGGSEVILDDDLNLEGVAMIAQVPFANRWTFLANAGSTLVRENYDDLYSEEQTDNSINWGQLAFQWANDDFKVLFGAGFFNFVAFQGRTFAELSVDGAPNGNSEDPPGVVKDAYVPRQYFVETGARLGAYDWSFFVERVINDETRDANRAWWIGTGLARAAWEMQVAYGELQSDAVPATFTNSTFANGQTDARGVQASWKWKFARNMSLRLTEYANRLNYSDKNTQYLCHQIDLTASF